VFPQTDTSTSMTASRLAHKKQLSLTKCGHGNTCSAIHIRQYTSHQKASTANQSFFELPFLSTHWTKLIHLLRVEPLDNAVNMKAV